MGKHDWLRDLWFNLCLLNPWFRIRQLRLAVDGLAADCREKADRLGELGDGDDGFIREMGLGDGTFVYLNTPRSCGDPMAPESWQEHYRIKRMELL